MLLYAEWTHFLLWLLRGEDRCSEEKTAAPLLGAALRGVNPLVVVAAPKRRPLLRCMVLFTGYPRMSLPELAQISTSSGYCRFAEWNVGHSWLRQSLSNSSLESVMPVSSDLGINWLWQATSALHSDVITADVVTGHFATYSYTSAIFSSGLSYAVLCPTLLSSSLRHFCQ